MKRAGRARAHGSAGVSKPPGGAATPRFLALIYGDESGRFIPGQDPAAAAKQLFTNVEVRIQEHSTHSGPMERPDLFEAAIREFATRVTRNE